MLPRLRLSVLACLLIITLATLAIAQRSLTGTWSAKSYKDDKIHLEMSFESGRNNFGNTFKITDLGLAPEAITATKRDAQFQLARDAGTIAFTGIFNAGRGIGEFTFTPNAEFTRDMKAAGLSFTDREQFSMAALDVSRPYYQELKAIGYDPDTDELISARIFGVSAATVKEIVDMGYERPPLKQMVALRIHGVTPAFVREIKEAGMGTQFSLEKLMEFRIHGVTKDYVRELRTAFPDVTSSQIVETRIHGVKPEMIREFAEVGSQGLTVRDLIDMRIHGVTPQFIRDMKELGLGNLSSKLLQELRIFGVKPETVRGYRELGLTGLSAKQLVELRIHNIDRKFIERVHKAGYKQPSVQQLVEMKLHGIPVRGTEM